MNVNFRVALFALASIVFLTTAGIAQQVESTWSGVNGNWSDPSMWSNGVPQNLDDGLDYVAEVTAGELKLDISPIVSKLVVRGGKVDLPREFDPETNMLVQNTLTVLGDVDWMDGTLARYAGLNVLGNFFIDRGDINTVGEFEASRLIKSGWSLARLRPSVLDGGFPVEIQQGVLELTNNGALPMNAKTVEITAREFAAVNIQGRTNNDYILNSATGFRNEGPLRRQSFAPEIDGDIYLGDDGARLNLDLVLRGDIHGGELTINGYLAHLGHSSDYSGPTNIGIDGRFGELDLTRGGIASPNTTEVNVGVEGRLRFGNQYELLEDRLADDIPINLHGGRISIVGVNDRSGTTITERLGDVVLHKGSALLESVGFHTLEIADLVRHEESTIQFGVARGGANYSVKVGEPLDLKNEIIGPWAVAFPADFLTYEDGQVIRLGDRVTRPEDINSALPTDHFRLRSFVEQVRSDRSIYSLASDFGSETYLNLRGFTLNIVSGGLVVGQENIDHSTKIINGTLTVGIPGESSELYVHSVSRRTRWDQKQLSIEADIVDNNGGPLRFIKSGPGSTWLSGENAYSGGTLVNRGHLIVEKEHSLPGTGGLDINGGVVRLDFDSDTPKRFDTIRIGQNGSLFENHPHEPSISFSSMEMESGIIDVELVGDGSIEKRTQGTSSISSNNPSFHGNVAVHEGALVAGANDRASAAEMAFGTGTVTVHEDGTLLHGSSSQALRNSLLHANIQLDGGDVGISAGNFHQPWEWTFTGPWTVSKNSRLLAVDPEYIYREQDTADTLVRIVDGVEIMDDSQLEVIGPTAVQFGSPLTLRPNASLLSTTDLVFDSPLRLSQGASLISNASVDGSIVVENGGILQVDDGNASIARMEVQQMEWGSAGRLLDWNVEKQAGKSIVSDFMSTDTLRITSSVDSTGVLQLTGALQLNETEKLHELKWLVIAADTVEGVPAIDIDVSLFTTNLVHDAQIRPSLVDGVGLFLGVEFRSDYNDNGHLDVADIDFMCSDVGRSGISMTDLDGDGVTTLVDYERLIAHNIGTSKGDTNLDFQVDFADFLNLSAAFGTSAGWAHGDSDCSGTVDFGDFLALSRNFQSGTQASVPEPTSIPWILLLVICILARREMQKAKAQGAVAYLSDRNEVHR